MHVSILFTNLLSLLRLFLLAFPDQVDATNRLVSFRCRLAQRGIGAGPIAPDYCPLPQDQRRRKQAPFS
jgi:hypothetical protein